MFHCPETFQSIWKIFQIVWKFFKVLFKSIVFLPKNVFLINLCMLEHEFISGVLANKFQSVHVSETRSRLVWFGMRAVVLLLCNCCRALSL